MTSDVWTKLWELSALIKDPWALAACILVAAMFLSLRKHVPTLAWTVLIAEIVVVAFAIGMQALASEPAYNVRVITKDASRKIVQVADRNIDARIRNEKKPVRDEWQFDIATADLPSDRTVTLWAQAPEQLLGLGETKVHLDGRQRQVNAEIILPSATLVNLKGIVIDRSGAKIVGARVFAPTAQGKAALSDENGGFILETNVAEGDQVLLHTEAKGFLPDNQSYTATDKPITITMEKTRNGHPRK